MSEQTMYVPGYNEYGHYDRKASRSELVGAVRGLEGVEERAWCEVHDAQSWDGRDLFCLLHPGDPEERSCRMSRVLVVPFDLTEIATGWQTGDIRRLAECSNCRDGEVYPHGDFTPEPCPACGGSGLDGVEAAAQAIVDLWHKTATAGFEEMAAAAIRAWLDEIGGQDGRTTQRSARTVGSHHASQRGRLLRG